MKTSEDYYYSVFFSSVDVASLKLNQNFILTTAKKKITILKLFCILQVHVVQVAIIVIVIVIMIMMMMMTTLTMTMTIIDYYYYYLLLPQQR